MSSEGQTSPGTTLLRPAPSYPSFSLGMEGPLSPLRELGPKSGSGYRSGLRGGKGPGLRLTLTSACSVTRPGGLHAPTTVRRTRARPTPDGLQTPFPAPHFSMPLLRPSARNPGEFQLLTALLEGVSTVFRPRSQAAASTPSAAFGNPAKSYWAGSRLRQRNVSPPFSGPPPRPFGYS